MFFLGALVLALTATAASSAAKAKPSSSALGRLPGPAELGWSQYARQELRPRSRVARPGGTARTSLGRRSATDLAPSQPQHFPRPAADRSLDSAAASLAPVRREATEPGRAWYIIFVDIGTASHSAVYIEGEANQPAMRIERTFGVVDGGSIVTRVVKFSLDTIKEQVDSGAPTMRGTTTLRNEDIFNPHARTGLVMQSIDAVGPYRAGVSDCHTFARDLAWRLGGSPDPAYDAAVSHVNGYSEGKPSAVDTHFLVLDQPAVIGGSESKTIFERAGFDLGGSAGAVPMQQTLLVNEVGRLVDQDGRLLNRWGVHVDSAGRPVDQHGRVESTDKLEAAGEVESVEWAPPAFESPPWTLNPAEPDSSPSSPPQGPVPADAGDSTAAPAQAPAPAKEKAQEPAQAQASSDPELRSRLGLLPSDLESTISELRQLTHLASCG